jgi:hypothetical protein
LAALLRHYNASVVPFRERQIPIYVRPGVFLATRTGAGDFINNQFSNPEAAARQCLRHFPMAENVWRAIQKTQARRPSLLGWFHQGN